MTDYDYDSNNLLLLQKLQNNRKSKIFEEKKELCSLIANYVSFSSDPDNEEKVKNLIDNNRQYRHLYSTLNYLDSFKMHPPNNIQI